MDFKAISEDLTPILRKHGVISEDVSVHLRVVEMPEVVDSGHGYGFELSDLYLHLAITFDAPQPVQTQLEERPPYDAEGSAEEIKPELTA